MRSINFALVPLLGLALACQKQEHRPDAQQPTARQVTAMSGDTAWVRGGRKADHVLRYPEFLAHDSTQVYVTDMASHQVLAVDQRTGAINWTTSNAGVLRAPTSIAGLPGGGVAALDESGSLVRIDARGRILSSTILADGSNARQVCALSDSTFLIAFARKQLPLIVLDVSGNTLQRYELPWAELRELEPLQTQVFLAGSSPNRCVASLVYGHGLAAISKDRVEWTAPYVERVDMPRVNEKKTSIPNGEQIVSHIGAQHVAVRDISVDGNHIEIIFEGAERAEGSLIDEYDAKTGAYRRTRTAGRRVMGIQKSGDRAFLLVGLAGYPALVAMPMRDQQK